MDILDDVVVVLRVVLDYLGIDMEDVVISPFEIFIKLLQLDGPLYFANTFLCTCKAVW